MKSGVPGGSPDNPSIAKSTARGRHAGTVPVRNDRIVALREAKDWSQRTLANHAVCSLTTIKNVEAGKEAFPSTLERIAKALGVSYSEVCAKARLTLANPFKSPQIRIRWTIDVSFSDFDETEELQRRLEQVRRAINAVGELGNPVVEEGSVIITTEASEADTLRFVRAFCSGRLDEQNLTKIEIGDENNGRTWFLLNNRYDEAIEWFESNKKQISKYDDVYNNNFIKNLLERHLWVRGPYRKFFKRIKFLSKIMFELRHTTSDSKEIKLDIEDSGLLAIRRTGDKGSLVASGKK